MKKTWFNFIVLQGLLFSSISLIADIDFGGVEVSYDKPSYSQLYYFVGKQSGALKLNQEFNLDKLAQAYVGVLNADSSFSDISFETTDVDSYSFFSPSMLGLGNQTDYAGKKLIRIKSTKKKKTQHGDITLKGSYYLVSMNENTFEVFYRSEEIEATGYAKSTKVQNETFLIKRNNDGLFLSMQRELYLDKPGIAPEGIFINSVKSGVSEDFSELRDLHTGVFARV